MTNAEAIPNAPLTRRRIAVGQPVQVVTDPKLPPRKAAASGLKATP